MYLDRVPVSLKRKSLWTPYNWVAWKHLLELSERIAPREGLEEGVPFLVRLQLKHSRGSSRKMWTSGTKYHSSTVPKNDGHLKFFSYPLMRCLSWSHYLWCTIVTLDLDSGFWIMVLFLHLIFLNFQREGLSNTVRNVPRGKVLG